MKIENGSYYIASGLVGFRSDELRVKALRSVGDCVVIRTADLLSSGIALALSKDQLRSIDDSEPIIFAHPNAIVVLRCEI